MSNGSRKTLSIGLVVLMALAGLVYEFGIKSAIAKKQEWQGTITELTRKRDWIKGFQKPGRAEYHYYDHYWIVKCDDGREIEVEVLHTRWGEANIGDPVRKVRGERWPELVSEEAMKVREEKKKALDIMFNGPKKEGGSQP